MKNAGFCRQKWSVRELQRLWLRSMPMSNRSCARAAAARRLRVLVRNSKPKAAGDCNRAWRDYEAALTRRLPAKNIPSSAAGAGREIRAKCFALGLNLPSTNATSGRFRCIFWRE